MAGDRYRKTQRVRDELDRMDPLEFYYPLTGQVRRLLDQIDEAWPQSEADSGEQN